MKWVMVALLVMVAAWMARRQETKDEEKRRKQVKDSKPST